MQLPVTFFLTAIFALMLVALSAFVSMWRRVLNVAFGDGNSDVLRRRIRAHANFIENAPFLILMTGALEIGQATQWVIGLIAIGFLLARMLHAFAILFGRDAKLRAAAMLLQHFATVIAAVYLIILVVAPDR
ncbi:MAG TPA: MAPEG family protein [Asticcacaulis sp.]|nr:MAPEG family protein [Asticcacaulis sp.]